MTPTPESRPAMDKPQDLFWHCAHCGDHIQAVAPYVHGDHEPCDCGEGVARVMTVKEAAALEQRISLGWKPPSPYTKEPSHG
jgi:hypothetical protein